MRTQVPDLSFDVSHEGPASDVLVAGFSQFGLAGLTAVDYLHEQLELEQRGRILARGLPTITPFEGGSPRHHTRLFSHDDAEMTTLVGEMLLPVWAASTFTDALLDWVAESSIEEVLVLSGVPVEHGPDEHRTFHVSSEDFQAHRLAEADVPGMGNGFLDGVNGALVERGLESDVRVGILVTPVHAQTPDVEAAVRLLETTADLYDLDLDMGPLRAFADQVTNYYAELQERMAAAQEESERAMPVDRMFM